MSPKGGSGPVRVAVDGMGGDNAPGVVVEGVVELLRRDPGSVEPVLVGDEARIRAELDRLDASSMAIPVVHAGQHVEMGEAGADAFRKKRDSSLAVATRLVRDGEVQGVFSAGNTGAMVAASLLNIGRIPGVTRPAIATLIPTSGEPHWAIMLDVGATADCKPQNLYQFGILGEIYARILLKLDNPRVGLLNIGEEPSKGNELAQAAYELMAHRPGFVGNVEGRDVLRGKAQVVVTDGFTGNIMLKFAESVWTWTSGIVRKELGEHLLAKLGGLLLKPSIRRIKGRMDYSEYGGAPLLGVDGISIIGHGSSNAKAIGNAVRLTADLARSGLLDQIRRAVEKEHGGQVVNS